MVSDYGLIIVVVAVVGVAGGPYGLCDPCGPSTWPRHRSDNGGELKPPCPEEQGGRGA